MWAIVKLFTCTISTEKKGGKEGRVEGERKRAGRRRGEREREERDTDALVLEKAT